MRSCGIDYFENSRRAAFVQQRYAMRNPRRFKGYGEHCWGITAGEGPGPATRRVGGVTRRFFDYRARGAPYGPDDGTLAPWAAIASLPFAPEIVVPTIRHLQRVHADTKSAYGFLGSFNPTFPARNGRGWIAERYLGLNEGPIVLMIENHRTGLLWKLTKRCPYLVTGTPARRLPGRLAGLAMRIRPKIFLLFLSPVLLLVAAAYLQWGVAVSRRCRPSPSTSEAAAGPYGFPAWLRVTHYVNFLFLILLIRSGLQILMDHPRLYWNVHCTPGTEWLRLTPVEVPQGPRLDGQGRLPLPLALDRPARLPAHHRHGPALALPQRAVLGGQRRGLRGPAVRHRPVAATGADVLADRARRLGRLRPLRHLPPAAGAERLLPLQPAPAVGVLRGGVRPGTPGDPDRPLDVAGPDEPVQVVSEAARQPAGRPVDPLPHHVRLRRLPRRSRDDGGAHRVRPEHEPHRRGHRRRRA